MAAAGRRGGCSAAAEGACTPPGLLPSRGRQLLVVLALAVLSAGVVTVELVSRSRRAGGGGLRDATARTDLSQTQQRQGAWNADSFDPSAPVQIVTTLTGFSNITVGREPLVTALRRRPQCCTYWRTGRARGGAPAGPRRWARRTPPP